MKPLRNVLLVEDDPVLTLLMKDYLELCGYVVTISKNGKAGLDLVQRLMPSVVICDVTMQEMTSYEFIQGIRASTWQYTDLPVILLSGYGSPKEQLQGLEAGADAYIVKPFDIDQVITQFEHCLRLKNYQKQAV
jgi:DNA-binding response OmpR family regulator